MITTTPSESTTPVASPIAQNVLVTLDARGRVRVSKEQRRAILAEFERSGVSAAQFAKGTGLKYSTLAGWRQRYRRAKPKAGFRGLRLLEAGVDPNPAPGQRSQNVLMGHFPGQGPVQ